MQRLPHPHLTLCHLVRQAGLLVHPLCFRSGFHPCSPHCDQSLRAGVGRCLEIPPELLSTHSSRSQTQGQRLRPLTNTKQATIDWEGGHSDGLA
jgi:hypothetical protein